MKEQSPNQVPRDSYAAFGIFWDIWEPYSDLSAHP